MAGIPAICGLSRVALLTALAAKGTPSGVTMPNTITPLAYSVEEAAQQLSVSSQSVRRLIDRGELKARRVGTRVIVPKNELERWLEGSRR